MIKSKILTKTVIIYLNLKTLSLKSYQNGLKHLVLETSDQLIGNGSWFEPWNLRYPSSKCYLTNITYAKWQAATVSSSISLEEYILYIHNCGITTRSCLLTQVYGNTLRDNLRNLLSTEGVSNNLVCNGEDGAPKYGKTCWHNTWAIS